MLSPASYVFLQNQLPQPDQDIFSGLEEKERSELQQLLIPISCRRRTVLCMEGQQAEGLFLIRSGRIKEVMLSCEGKALIVRIAGRGDVIGLSAVISEKSFETTAEALEPVQADFVPGEKFRRMLKTSEGLGRSVVEHLSQTCANAYNGIRRLALSSTVPERLASFVLQWAETSSVCAVESGEIQIRVFLNHEEIAQALGSTRESVSRALTYFQKQGWVRIKGGAWTITNKSALQAMSRHASRVLNSRGVAAPEVLSASEAPGPQLLAVNQP